VRKGAKNGAKENAVVTKRTKVVAKEVSLSGEETRKETKETKETKERRRVAVKKVVRKGREVMKTMMVLLMMLMMMPARRPSR
jgi:hypothetical protein